MSALSHYPSRHMDALDTVEAEYKAVKMVLACDGDDCENLAEVELTGPIGYFECGCYCTNCY